VKLDRPPTQTPNLTEMFYVYNENMTKMKISVIMADKYNRLGMCTSVNYSPDESVNFIINNVVIFVFTKLSEQRCVFTIPSANTSVCES
jgi:hypothetical protein